ncbi:metal dependent phosphohydrolase [Desulfovibrio sp. X2]|uniref:3'-5' exoribonuclease YhaM family protein n=1 Tax=Desulfovibrio sp. X2 TaxID=941449 RepID=UPI0003587F1B|nr:HD domain-containing protein [Desulfovibrio sp. X2]EPR44788.1 metal dependent phosphohydrolase [Desulfovibrio sp. X2]
MTQKTAFVQDLAPGQNVADLFVIAEAKQATSRNGPYWSLTLSDRSGRVEAKVWSPLAQTCPPLAGGQVARVAGSVETYRDKPQIVVREIELVEGELQHAELAALLPVSAVPPEELLRRLEDLLQAGLAHKPWRRLCSLLLNDDEVRARLLAAPGAKSIHHAYQGGLLEHTLAVCRICHAAAALYPHLDGEVLLVAAALHDLGKAWELAGGLAQDFTDEGRLLGHIQIGVEKLEPFLRKARLEPELALHLKHMILAHHGELAYGSPKRPKTAEAVVLHFADQMDSKLGTFASAFDAEAPDGSWSPYVRSLERFLYRPAPTPKAQSKNDNKEPTQCLLPLKA